MLTNSTEQRLFQFEILYQSKRSRARVGRLITPHGIIDTPNFVGVGTNGSLKGLYNHELTTIVPLMFCNTYHLMVQPGTALVKAAGGLHTFIQRAAPIITDSGGFQVFSLAYGQVAKELKGQGGKKHPNSVLRVTEEGVTFRSYKNGEKIFLSPETSIEAQKDLGADIIIPLDELLPFHVDDKKHRASFERTHRWELRSLQTHRQDPRHQAIFAVIHGGTDLTWRKESCEQLSQHAFDGFAIGGSLGCDHPSLFATVAGTTAHLPPEAPIHLLGIGDVASLSTCISHGVDTFDSAYPTKVARHGLLMTKKGPVKIRRQTHAREFFPIEEDCSCPTCRQYTRAYLHHLFKANEPSGASLASWHNIIFMMEWMKATRTQILCGLL